MNLNKPQIQPPLTKKILFDCSKLEDKKTLKLVLKHSLQSRGNNSPRTILMFNQTYFYN